jgi:transcriptional regulator with GAF, ATPase, and Fis domain
MIAPNHTQIQIPINSQIDALKGLADRVLASFESGDSTNINANLRNLTYLSNELSKVSKKIAAYEAEHENLIALAEVGQLVNSSLELNKVLRYVMDTIIRLTHAERGFLMLLDDDGEMKIQIARNWEQESIDPTESEISHTIIDRVIREEQPIITTNAQEDPRDPRFESQHSVITFNLRSILCVPLKVKDKIIGVIYTDNRIRTGLFNETQKDLLNNFSNQAAIAIDNARLFESVRQTLAEVTELKNLMDNVFASIASGVITTDIENKIILCNQAAERILGMAQTDIVGISLRDGLPGLFQHLRTKMDEVRRFDQQIIGQEVKLVQNQNDRRAGD